MDKNPPANAGDSGSIPGLRRFHMLSPCATTTETEIQRQRRAQKWEKHGTEYPAKGHWFAVEELNQAADITLLELS